jgi:hypothetical protein
MSFIAQRPVRPAESDVTDVDDGGAQIAIGTFWPTVKLHDLRLAARIAGDITTSRLMHMATEAALHVADQLKDWRKQREAEGAESLASVLLTSAGEPVEQINGESAKFIASGARSTPSRAPAYWKVTGTSAPRQKATRMRRPWTGK